ncbi:hypothetical protein AAFN60_19240 [Roseibacillus persicicus]|uniref:hypothetical protein n=1 Tax=Roseibacillus persicicus TaxID=454148 RepID=UPI00398B68E6
MRVGLSDGYITHDQIVHQQKGSLKAASGIVIGGPSLENASRPLLNQVEDEVRASVLRSLRPGKSSLQVRYDMCGGYASELELFGERTSTGNGSSFSKRQRNWRLGYYSSLDDEGVLRRPRVSFFLSNHIELKGGHSSSNLSSLLETSARVAKVEIDNIRKSMERLGGYGKPMGSIELFEECYRHLNKAVAGREAQIPEGSFRPEQSILENCLAGELQAVRAAEQGFYYDQHHHAFLTVSALPQVTYSGLITALTGVPIRDFAIVLNIEPLDAMQRIEQEGRIRTKLERALRSGHSAPLLHRIQAADERSARLMSNEVLPFEVQIQIHCWAPSVEALQEKMAVLKTAVSHLQGAKYYEMANPVSSRECFLAMTPAAPRQGDFYHYIEDENLANLIPISGELDESLGQADAIYHDKGRSLFGVQSSRKNTPQHVFVTGWSGGGKSMFCADWLIQTEHQFDYTVIIDDGNSYGTYVKTTGMDARSFVIEANGKETLNYLDPSGVLTNQHLADASAVVLHMLGDEGGPLYEALIRQSLQKFYRAWGKKWQKANPRKLKEVLSVRLHLKNLQNQESHDTLPELFSRFQREGFSGSESYDGSDEELEAILTDEPETTLSLCFAFTSPREMPRHRDFHAFVEQLAKKQSRHQRELEIMATLLEEWLESEGRYGPILDGWNTIDLSAKVVHIELGRITSATPRLRQLAGFIITNQVRNQIVLHRSREERKRVLLEELGGFLEIKGGPQLVNELYQRMRRYNCPVWSVIQQVSSLPESVRSALLGNVRMGFFFKQKYEKDARALQEAFHLPNSTVDDMLGFPDPSKEEGAPFVYWQNSGRNPRIISGCCVASPETLYMGRSDGAHHSNREQQLRGYASVEEAIICETAKLEE